MAWVQDAASAIADELRGGYGTSYAHLEDAVQLLRDVAEQLRHQALDGALRSKLDEVTELAHRQMASWTGTSQTAARRLYTDACILLALDDVRHFYSAEQNSYALSAVANLDYAIIIAGAAGEGRQDLIIDLIKLVQRTCLTAPVDSHITFELSLGAASVARQALPSATASVHRVAAPSLASFRSTLSRAPFVLPGYITDWPAMTDHPWVSLEYLRAAAGPGRVVPVEVGRDYREADWTQCMMPWAEFLHSLEKGGDGDVLYLAQHNLLTQFPALREDIIVPDYVYASLTAPDEYPSYRPPGNEEQLVLNAWLGPAGTISPAHTDPYFNLYAQVVGRKTVWLAPPRATPFMHAYAASTASANQPHNPAANHTEPFLSNTSRVDVFTEDTREAQREFPLFWERAVPQAMVVTLEPGDLLFFPPGWWHAMRSEETSFSVSMWF